MTDHTADVEYHDYQATVPKIYIALAWLWVAIPFAYPAAQRPLIARRSRRMLG
jgi:hypothetical protein